MLAAHTAYALEVSLGRKQHSARADDGLAEEGRDTIRPGLLDCLLERLDRVPGHLNGVGHEHPDPLPEHIRAGKACRIRGEPVVGALARDRHGALGLAHQAPVAPGELRRRLDRLRAAAREEDDGVLHGRDRGDPLGKLGRRAGREVAVRRVCRDLAHLGSHRVGYLATPVADVAVPETRTGIEVAPALDVPDPHALGVVENELAVSRDSVHIGHRVPEARHRHSVPGFYDPTPPHPRAGPLGGMNTDDGSRGSHRSSLPERGRGGSRALLGARC